MLPEGFTPEDVGEMNLDHGQPEREQRIEQCNGGCRIPRRIDDDPCGAPLGLLHPADQFALMMRLREIDRQATPARMLATAFLDIGYRLAAVNLRLTAAQ